MRAFPGVCIVLLLIGMVACGGSGGGDGTAPASGTGSGSGTPSAPSASTSTPSAASCTALAFAQPAGSAPLAPTALKLDAISTALSFPLFMTAPPCDTARLFVVEKGGNIRIIKNGVLLSKPFLSLTGQVSTGGEQGLLGLAFDPNYLCFNPSSNCNPTNTLTLPVLDYTHADGCAVTGGYVYRGAGIPALRGTYFYADLCQGWVRSFRFQNGQPTEQTDWPLLRPSGNITSFGEDGRGEVYVMTSQGGLFRIVAN